MLIETAEFHHRPELSTGNSIVAAVQIADMLVRHARLGNSGNWEEVTEENWLNATGWAILLPRAGQTERDLAHAAVKRSLERLPQILEGLL